MMGEGGRMGGTEVREEMTCEGKHTNLSTKYDVNSFVDISFNFAHFRGCVPIVHLDLGLLSAIHSYAISPLSVGEEGATKKQIVGSKRDGISD
jgi:hypothetical protein